MSDLDLTEAKAVLAQYIDKVLDNEAWASTGAEAAEHIVAEMGWAPARQVAERIAERIEAESDRRDQPGLTWAAETSTHRKAGWDAGMTTAARIAREVGSDG